MEDENQGGAANDGAFESSLFEGMDLVLSTPINEEFGQRIQPEIQASKPLDEDLFSGLKAAQESSSVSVQEEPESSLRSMPSSSFESIMAAYDQIDKPTVNQDSAVLAAGFNGLKTSSGRKKKKSVRIGYGRNFGEPVDSITAHNEVKVPIAAEEVPIQTMDIAEFEAILHEKEEGELSGDGRISVSASEASQTEELKISQPEEVKIFQTEDVKISGEKELQKLKTEDQVVEEVSSLEKLENDEPVVEVSSVMGKSQELSTDAAAETMDQENATGVEDRSEEEQLDSFEEIVNATSLSLEKKLKAVKELTERRLKDLEVRASTASSARKVAAQSRRQAAQALSAAAAKRKELEAELDGACEREDFELADKLSEEVAKAQDSLESIELSFKEAEAKYDSAAFALEGIIRLQMAVEEEGEAALVKLQKEAEACATKLQTESEEAAKNEFHNLHMREEELENRRTQYRVQETALGKAGADLEKVIAKSIEPELQEKATCVAGRNILAEELSELLQKVKAKEAEIAECDLRIQEIGTRIASVVGGFEEQHAKIKDESNTVARCMAELEVEFLNVQELKKKAEENVAAADAESRSLRNIATLAADEAAQLHIALEKRRRGAASAKDIKQKKATLVKEEEELLAQAHALKQEASAARTLLQELSSTKIRLQQDINSGKQRIDYLEKRGPEIDAEKRLAAAARNFKEAARLSSEAKALLAEKETCSGELQKSTSQLQKLEEEIEAKVLSLADIERLIGSKEKEAARTCCERLRLVAKAARDEQDIAAELEDYEEAESLQAEADAADAEADELQRIHQFEGEQFEKVSGRSELAAAD